MAHVTFTRARLQATAALAGGLGLWWRFHSTWAIALAAILAVLALLAWFAPERHKPVQRALDWTTRLLVAGFTWLILGLVYYALFTPMRWLGVLMGRDSLRLKPNHSATTYLRDLPSASEGRFDRQF
jgi:hypothetical protein